MTTSQQLRAELAMRELEEQFVAAKERGEVTAELKKRLRAARQQHRLLREAAPPETGAARPQPASATAKSMGVQA